MDFYCSDLIPAIEYFVDRKCLPVWNIQEGRIGFHDLIYVYKGRAVYYMDGKPFKLEQGDMLYAPKGIVRKAYTDLEDLMHCYAFNFQIYNPSGEISGLPIPPVTKIGLDTDLIELYREFNQAWLEKEEGYMLKCRAIFMLILHKLIIFHKRSMLHPRPDARIRKVKEHISMNYSGKITVDMLAETINLNPVYFGAFFKKHTGYSVKEYINLIRIRKSRDLLSTGEYSVKETAYLCGFEDIYYFSKVFKRITGTSPSYYVKSMFKP